jgi:ATP-binding cassette subfamily F protein 3
MSFQFPPAPASGKLGVEVTGLSKSFDNKTVFDNLSFTLQRGDKLAIVGVNGAGKSTLVKLLAGLLTPDDGSITFGHNVITSYFGQHQAQELTPGYSILETLNHVENDLTVTQGRSLLGAFLFTGDDVEKMVEVLSGGEKSRVALAKMIATPANLLILDEPTNHLDITSQKILQEAMHQYDGTIILVSHNRYFANGFVNKVLEIKDHAGTMYEGNIEDYLYRKRHEAEELPGNDKNLSSTRPARKGKEEKRRQAELRQEKSRKVAPLKTKTDRCEEAIDKLESRKVELTEQLANPELYQNKEVFAELSSEFATTERRLAREYHTWEELHSQIEEIEIRYAKLLED